MLLYVFDFKDNFFYYINYLSLLMNFILYSRISNKKNIIVKNEYSFL